LYKPYRPRPSDLKQEERRMRAGEGEAAHRRKKEEEAQYRKKKAELLAAESRAHNRDQHGSRKHDVHYRSTVIDEGDEYDGYGRKVYFADAPAPKGILKRSRSTSSRPAFPHVAFEPFASYELDKPAPRLLEPPPRRSNMLPIRSGYPSVHQTDHIREEVVLIPNDSRRDRERMRARHHSETPPYRPAGPGYRSGVTSPRSPASGALLEVPSHGYDHRSRSAERRDNGGGAWVESVERVDRVERVERRPSVDRRPSNDKGKGKGKGKSSEQVVIVRRTSDDKGKAKADEDGHVAERRPSSSRKQSNADRQPRVEDAEDEDDK
jgi:hypothetical protein